MTLVEVMITMVLVVGLVSVLGSLLVSQARLFARTRGATAVQRDLRMGLALLPMDLRAASRADRDLITLNATSIDLKATIGSSIVCDTVAAAKTTITIPPADMPQALLTSFFTPPAAGDSVRVLVRTQTGGVGDRWLPGAIGAAGPTTLPAGAASCGATSPFNPQAGSGSRPTSLPIVWPASVTAADRALIVNGAPLRVLRRIRYELYQETSGRWYLGYSELVGGLWSAREPIAGPYEAPTSPLGAGIGFAYFDTLGVRLAAPSPDQVGRIDLTLRPRTQVRGGGRDSVIVRDSALIRVSLRNRL